MGSEELHLTNWQTFARRVIEEGSIIAKADLRWRSYSEGSITESDKDREDFFFTSPDSALDPFALMAGFDPVVLRREARKMFNFEREPLARRRKRY